MRVFAFALGAILGSTSLGAATIRVPADRPTIQDALDAAADGDTVLVAPGEYVLDAPLDLNRLHRRDDPASPPRKDVALVSEAGAEETVLRMGIPRDPARASVVIFQNDETEASRIDGFTITGGAGTSGILESGPVGGGIAILGNTPLVLRCRILRNRAVRGGGLYVAGGEAPRIDACVIEGNWARDRGGALYSEGYTSLRSCRILGNWAGLSGGGVRASRGAVTLSACVLAGNYSAGVSAIASGSSVSFSRSTLIANASASGGEPFLSNATDSIVWLNEPATDYRCEILRATPRDLCGIDPMLASPPLVDFARLATVEVAGVPHSMPDFIVTPGDYRLQAGSPAIDAGTSELRDADGTPPEAGAFPVDQGPPPPPRTIGVDLGGGGDFTSLQEAILASNHGDEIVVKPGTYELAKPLTLYGRAIRVRSEAGPEATVLRRLPPDDPDAYSEGVVQLVHGEPPETVLEGFTVTGGRGSYGGGVRVVGSATIRSCRIVGNETLAGYGGGGISYHASAWAPPGRIEDCVIEGNAARGKGFLAPGRGGGLYVSGGVQVVRCRITGNRADEGGGVYAGAATFTDCLIDGNVALRAGGAIRFHPDTYTHRERVLRRCTVSGNASAQGGAISLLSVSASVESSIVWDNAGGPFQPGPGSDIAVRTSCVESDPPWPGEGNLALDPLFAGWPSEEIHVDASAPDGGDGGPRAPLRTIADALETFRWELGDGSPCLGAGKDGEHQGALPAAGAPPGPRECRILVAPGRYVAPVLYPAHHASLVGSGAAETTIESLVMGPRAGAAVEDVGILGGEMGTWIACSGESTLARRCTLRSSGSGSRPMAECWDGSTLVMEDCVLEGAPGSAVYGRSASLLCTGCSLRGSGRAPPPGSGWEAAIELEGGDATLRSCALSENGNPYCVSGTGSEIVIVDSRLAGNAGGLSLLDGSSAAVSGSVIEDHAGYALFLTASAVEVTGSRIQRTRGVWAWSGADVTLRASEVLSCGEDGGVSSQWGSKLVVDSSIVAGNYNRDGGGGVRVASSGFLKIVNSVIAGNHSRVGAGGIAILESGYHQQVLHCTFFRNGETSGADVSCVPSLLLGNSIIAGAGPSWACTSARGCLLGSDPLFERPGTFDLTRFQEVQILGSPVRFPDFIVDVGDYRLQPGSPAIDRGYAPLAPEVDIEGVSRPRGEGVDIGAYESVRFPQFRRGDGNADGSLDLADAVGVLLHLFVGDPRLPCDDAADADDSGSLEVTDALRVLRYLFIAGAPPAPPFEACGSDPSPDELSCTAFPDCGWTP